MKKDITKELLYLLAGIQSKKLNIKISENDLKYLGLSLNDLLRYCEILGENDKYYHLHITYNLIGLNLLIYKGVK